MDDLLARNKDHFDNDPSGQLSEWQDLINAIIEEIHSRRGWISSRWTNAGDSSAISDAGEIRLLDYACGSGTVSKALLPFISHAVGLDIAPGMVAEYNKWTRDEGLDPNRVHAYEYNLLGDNKSPPLPERSWSGFDVVVVSMALHHVSDPARLMRELSHRLRRGGVCVILDRVPDSTTVAPDVVLPEAHAKKIQIINQHGFSEADMRQLYQEAGLGHHFDYVPIPRRFKATVFGEKISIAGFIARGELM